MRRILLLASVIGAAVAGAFLGGSPGATSGPCVGTGTHPWKVLWIVMENKNYSEVIGSSSAPYENYLAAKCGLATNYHAITYPSLPNYIAATAGSTLGITSTCSPNDCAKTAASIFSQVGSKSYQEAMPSNCYLYNHYPYTPKHNPEVYYSNIRTACKNGGDVPMGTVTSGRFHNAVIAGKLPRFAFITPNLCHDTHDCSVRTGDDYLRSLIPRIVAGPDYQAGRLVVFLTWDENHGLAGNRVPIIVISRPVPPGTRSGTRFSHYSLLRTTERLLGVPLLRNAQTANSMRATFGL